MQSRPISTTVFLILTRCYFATLNSSALMANLGVGHLSYSITVKPRRLAMLLDHRALLHCAYVVAQKSRDPSTQNGALRVTDNGFVQVEGVNQFPYGVRETEERWQR